MSGRTDGDLISRAAAIEELESAKVYMTAHEDGVNIGNIFAQYNRGLSDGIDRLKQLPAAESDIIACADCRYAGEQIADGRYWCSYHEDYMRYCSDAERRQ